VLTFVQNRERAANDRSREDAHLYASHRDKLTQLIVSLDGGRRRLCLLGAGNCNDVDLSLVLERFSEVHLVDIDRAAVEHAIERQPLHLRARLHTHAPRDLSGLLSDLPRLLQVETNHTDEEFAAVLWPMVMKNTLELLLGLPGPFDVAVSCCVTTQLGVSLAAIVPDSHPRFEMLRAAMLRIHMRALLRLAPMSVWVSDVSSSEIHPIDQALQTQSPFELLGELSAVGAIHRSGNPELISDLVATDPLLADIQLLETYGPWVWRTRHKTFLVQAIRFGSGTMRGQV
jgi:hypothetical protein